MKEKFVRYGRLKPTKQKGFDSYKKDPWFHSPPKGKGFYAFPFGFEEIFLVVNLTYQTKTSRSLPNITKYEKWVNAKCNEVIFSEWETKDIWKHKRVFEVDASKTVWHHLEVRSDVVLEKTEHWTKTTIKEWKKALNKTMNKEKMKTWKEFTKKGGTKSVSELRKNGFYSKDHYEVFFDYKVS